MRTIIALIVLGLCAPMVGDVGVAEAQVWKVKRARAGAKPPKGKPPVTRTARPAVKKKPATKQRKREQELVPDDKDDRETSTEREDDDRRVRDDEDRRARVDDEDRVTVKVVEVFD